MNIKNKILASYTVVFLAIILMVLLSFDFFESNSEEKRNQFFCGTVDFDEEYKEGKKLFKMLCASCHKLDKLVFGPSLKKVEIDSISLFKYLKSNQHRPSFPQLSQENVNEVLKYIESKKPK
ncbi:hypothetical protein F7018_01885 [Tenacibaculum aiptasiae]|uniref:Cytochrome c domain-containing protein n=1 Tax=Tenacibaculum aiptasiae TaxID=426481 RepID=A0A7J5ASN8_9FLAO|nr:cytochrome c [Tenacibaculum aiptasiae]KAB1160648.1 hypothetical protein F7018_01885 [Tenacibaculum aiptasiae]